MQQTATPRSGPRRSSSRSSPAVGLGVVVVAIIAAFVLESAWSSARSLGAADSSSVHGVTPQPASSVAPMSGDVRPGGLDGAPPKVATGISEKDGVLPDGVTVFDTRYPGVTRLDP